MPDLNGLVVVPMLILLAVGIWQFYGRRRAPERSEEPLLPAFRFRLDPDLDRRPRSGS